MHNNIVKNFRWHQRKQTVEIEIALAAATAPSGMLCPDSDLPICYAYDWRKVLHPFSNKLSCLFPELFDLPMSILHHIVRLSLCQVFLDPIRFALYKSPGFLDTHPLGASDHDLPIRFDLDRDGFAVALYDLIRHIHTLISSTKNGWPF